jgi:hypothetical protein
MKSDIFHIILQSLTAPLAFFGCFYDKNILVGLILVGMAYLSGLFAIGAYWRCVQHG